MVEHKDLIGSFTNVKYLGSVPVSLTRVLESPACHTSCAVNRSASGIGTVHTYTTTCPRATSHRLVTACLTFHRRVTACLTFHRLVAACLTFHAGCAAHHHAHAQPSLPCLRGLQVREAAGHDVATLAIKRLHGLKIKDRSVQLEVTSTGVCPHTLASDGLSADLWPSRLRTACGTPSPPL